MGALHAEAIGFVTDKRLVAPGSRPAVSFFKHTVCLIDAHDTPGTIVLGFSTRGMKWHVTNHVNPMS